MRQFAAAFLASIGCKEEEGKLGSTQKQLHKSTIEYLYRSGNPVKTENEIQRRKRRYKKVSGEGKRGGEEKFAPALVLPGMGIDKKITWQKKAHIWQIGKKAKGKPLAKSTPACCYFSFSCVTISNPLFFSFLPPSCWPLSEEEKKGKRT